MSHYIKLRPNVANETLIFFSLVSQSKQSYDKTRIFSKALMRHEIDSSLITSLYRLCLDFNLVSNLQIDIKLRRIGRRFMNLKWVFIYALFSYYQDLMIYRHLRSPNLKLNEFFGNEIDQATCCFSYLIKETDVLFCTRLFIEN